MKLFNVHTALELAKYIVQTAKTLQAILQEIDIESVLNHVGSRSNEEANRLATSTFLLCTLLLLKCRGQLDLVKMLTATFFPFFSFSY